MSEFDINAAWVKTLRLRTGLTQKEFAKIVGCAERTVQDWEGGRYKPCRMARRAMENIAQEGGPGREAGTAVLKNVEKCDMLNTSFECEIYNNGQMRMKVNKERLRGAVAESEAGGGLDSLTALWEKVAAAYNRGLGHADRIGPLKARRNVLNPRSGITILTKAAKDGRPGRDKPRLDRDVLRALERAAVDGGWDAENEGWGTINRVRESLGMPPVAPVDGDRDVRLAAAKALLAVNGPGDPSAARVLVALIADPEPVGDRHQVLAALAAAGAETREQAVAALAGLLTRADPSVLPDVIDCLAAAGPVAKSALPTLEGLLKNKDANVRGSVGIAVAAIEGKGSPRAVKVLVGLVSDAEVPTGWRLAALESVREANPSALAGATPDLIRQLGDTDAGVRVAALEMLSQIVLDTRAELPGPAGGK